MLNKVWFRLLAGFLFVVFLAVGAVALVVGYTTQNSFRHYVGQRSSEPVDEALPPALQSHYAQAGSWQGVDAILAAHSGGRGQGQGQGQRGAQTVVADAAGVVVASNASDLIGTALDEIVLRFAVPLVVDGETVGWVARMTPGQQAWGEAETLFLADTAQRLALAALGAVAAAMLVSAVLARQFARPLRALTAAARRLAAGHLGEQVEVASAADEISELTGAFNHMSHDLAEAEAVRQRMTADIAHELRTPVSVLQGHIEAMIDGIFPPDAAHLAVAYDQTLHLARLVDDLRLLTLAEAGRLPLERVMVPPGELAAKAAARFEPLAHDAGLTLTHEIAPDLPPIHVDVDRLQQILSNLLSNALRYAGPEGWVKLRMVRRESMARFVVANSGPGLTPEQAAHVFERFWRADKARVRHGSGLGLAIAQQLVHLHGGRIWVESTPGETAFIFEIPFA